MKRIWLSPKLYRLLPLGYLFFGWLMLVNFGDDPLGRLSGILLWAAGVIVLALRLVGRGNERDT